MSRSTPPPPLPLSNQTSPQPSQSRSGHNYSHSHLSGLNSSSSNNNNSSSGERERERNSSSGSHSARPNTGNNQEQSARYRSSEQVSTGGGSARNWNSASIRPSASSAGITRPASELLQSYNSNQYHNNSNNYPSITSTTGSLGGNNSSNFASPETEAIDRWFEDLQHYEATLEEMAAASLDSNFKEELSAIEQWFRVLSEAERTAALYSLLQSSTQVQMRFFVTVLQQMARADPMTALLSPSNPGQLSMEDQMEAKLASMGLKSPASPAMRQFARQSLGAPVSSSTVPDNYLSPHSATLQQSTEDTIAANALASAQRSKLKANARISAPANILLGASGINSDSIKSPLWNESERVVERRSPSPSPVNRPKSTGSSLEAHPNGSYSGQHLSQSTGPPSSASFLRSPLPTQSDFDASTQLSPALGGSWASMVNTPLVPMFGSNVMDQSSGTFGGITSPGLDNASSRLTNWQSTGGNGNENGIVLDDVRKFRRSARISGSSTTGFGSGGSGGVSGGALGGMYEQQPTQQRSTSSSSANNQNQQQQQQNQLLQQQQQQQQQQQATLQSMQQNAINLGLAGLTNQQQIQLIQQQGQNRSGATSPGQLAAVNAQQNWRNTLLSPNSGVGNNNVNGTGVGILDSDQFAQQLNAFGLNPTLSSPNSGFLSGNNNLNSNNSNANSPNVQLANLIALQNHMIQQQQAQQQQQFQQLNLAAQAGIALTPVQLMSLQQQQARMGMGLMGGYGMGIGMSGINGMGSPRRSPRPMDRSPGGNSTHSNSNSPHPNSANPNSSSQNKASSTLPSATGSGSNPDEDLNMNLLNDTVNWLRSLRLHKYNSNFEGMSWKEMVLLDDEGLEGRGVSALGARRKLLKVFETVRSKTGMSLPGDSTNTTSSTSSPTNKINTTTSTTEGGSNRSNSPTDSAHEDA